MSADREAVLAAALEALAPASVLALGPPPVPGVAGCRARHPGVAVTHIDAPDPLPALEPLGRFDVALVAGLLEQLDHATGEQLLGRLRNLHTEHLLVLLGPEAPWRRNQLIGLGLRPTTRLRDASGEAALYAYSLASYNPVRSWNNPRFWANPENWGKYRW